MNFTPVIEFFLVMSIFFLYQRRVEDFITHTHTERHTEREREREREDVDYKVKALIVE